MGHFQLNLSVHLGVLLCFLVTVVQVFHEHSHHDIDEHELGSKHEAHKVQRGHELQAAQAAALVMGTVSQRVLHHGEGR
jgi:hypothetical protein